MCPQPLKLNNLHTSNRWMLTALYDLCSQLLHQLDCSKISARPTQHLALLVSLLSVLGVLVYLLKQ